MEKNYCQTILPDKSEQKPREKKLSKLTTRKWSKKLEVGGKTIVQQLTGKK